MISFEILFKKDCAIRSDLIVGVATNLEHKSHHLTIFVDRGLSTLHHQREEKSVTELSPCEGALTIGKLLYRFQCDELYVCKIDLANDLVENLAPAILEHLILVEFIGGDLNRQLQKALFVVGIKKIALDR